MEPPEFHAAPYAPLAGPEAIAQVWRLCGLLTLDVGGCWWPVGPPSVMQRRDAPFPGPDAAPPCDPEEIAWVTKPSWAANSPANGSFSPSCAVVASPWLDRAWSVLDADLVLDEAVRTHLTAARLSDAGHLFVEAAALSLIANLDARGKAMGFDGTKIRITEALTRSYQRHFCPASRAAAPEAAKLLFDLTYNPGRNRAAHEARLLHLHGPGSGPLGDKPRDIDLGVLRMHTQTIDALARQVRYLLREALGAPGPEAGRCVHTSD